MNDICESLYSKSSKGITARSVNIKDFEYWLTPAGLTANETKDAKEIQYTGGATETPVIYGKTDDDSDSYYSTPTTQGSENRPVLNIKEAGLTTEANEENYGEGIKALMSSKNYYIATRCVYDFETCAMFGLESFQNVKYSNSFWVEGTLMLLSGKGGYSGYIVESIRPVVTLKSSTIITASQTASSETGTPHHITQY